MRHAHGWTHWKWKRRLATVGFDFLAQLNPRARDREPIFVKELLDPHHRLHVALAVHALASAALYRFKLGEFSLPKAKNISGKAAQSGDFADAEIEFVRNYNFRAADSFLRDFLMHGLMHAHGGRFRTPVYAFLARAAPRNNTQKCKWPVAKAFSRLVACRSECQLGSENEKMLANAKTF